MSTSADLVNAWCMFQLIRWICDTHSSWLAECSIHVPADLLNVRHNIMFHPNRTKSSATMVIHATTVKYLKWPNYLFKQRRPLFYYLTLVGSEISGEQTRSELDYSLINSPDYIWLTSQPPHHDWAIKPNKCAHFICHTFQLEVQLVTTEDTTLRDTTL